MRGTFFADAARRSSQVARDSCDDHSFQFILQRGLRPDVDGLAFTVLAGLCWLRPGYAWWFAGCLFGALAPVAAPFMVAVIAPFGVWCLLERGIGETGRPSIPARFGGGCRWIRAPDRRRARRRRVILEGILRACRAPDFLCGTPSPRFS